VTGKDGAVAGEPTQAAGWRPGDRVEVWLPEWDAPRKRGGAPRCTWISGTVRQVDPPGLQPGVSVDLDRMVNGVQTCYATHAELRAEE
jgi:hypothetical protein